MLSPLAAAIVCATYAHEGQTDKGGAPYILHPLRVMLAMGDDEARVVAVLHDVLEDCPAWTLRVTLNPAQTAALEALTRREGEAYAAFIERCGADPLARRVKLADLADNMDVARLPRPYGREVWARHDRYQRAFWTLSNWKD